MLAFLGGRERTQAGLAALFHQAGLQLTRVIATQVPMCIVEATTV